MQSGQLRRSLQRLYSRYRESFPGNDQEASNGRRRDTRLAGRVVKAIYDLMVRDADRGRVPVLIVSPDQGHMWYFPCKVSDEERDANESEREGFMVGLMMGCGERFEEQF